MWRAMKPKTLLPFLLFLFLQLMPGASSSKTPMSHVFYGLSPVLFSSSLLRYKMRKACQMTLVLDLSCRMNFQLLRNSLVLYSVHSWYTFDRFLNTLFLLPATCFRVFYVVLNTRTSCLQVVAKEKHNFCFHHNSKTVCNMMKQLCCDCCDWREDYHNFYYSKSVCEPY